MRLGLWCALWALVAAPCAAQGRLELSPFVGLYVPAVHVVDISAVCPGGPCGEVVTQAIAPVVGARVTARASERVALDFSLGYSRTRVTRHGLLAEIPSGVLVGRTATDTSGPASITTGSARVLIKLSPHTDRAALYAAAGLAVVTHGGEAYSGVVGNTGWGPVVGAMGHVQLATRVTLRAQLDDYVYSFSGTAVTRPPTYSLGIVAGNYHSRVQHDLVVSLGVAVAP